MHPDLAVAAQALRGNDLAKAEAIIRATLQDQPENAEALVLLARIALATGFVADAEQLLRKAIVIEPALVEAQADLASLLCRLERAEEAAALMERAAARFPDALWPLSLKAAVLDTERRAEEALPLHEEMVARAPNAAIPWLNYGRALQAVGRSDDAVAAYRKSLQLDPGSGFAWCALANLRTVRLEAGDIASLESALSTGTDTLQRVQLHFALGRALGDHGRFERSFHHYERANRLRQDLIPYDAGITRDLAHKVETVFTAEFLAQTARPGCDEPGPIFVVGMPRSGSTLVEQILASHPMIEGCGELFELRNLAAGLRAGAAGRPWPEVVAGLNGEGLRALGQRYLASVRRHRRTGRPFFTDKMPSNWQFVGLIHLILPNARVVDVRRHPIACCFSAFTTYFNRETSFPTNLEDLGRYYADYRRMTAHFEAALPDKIYRVRHERLAADLEGEVRRLLDYLGLPFDAACLRFHENPRPVHTPSALQVRKPINDDGLGLWRNYEPWLAPLSDIMGQTTEFDPNTLA